MKNVYLFFISLFLLQSAFADFTYKDESKSSGNDAYKIRYTQKIEQLNGFYTTEYAGYQLVDQVFEGTGFQIFVKVGLVVSDEKLLKKFEPFKEGYLYHDHLGKTPIAIYFRNLDLQKAKQYKTKILRYFGANKLTLIDLIIPKANAGECDWDNGLTPSGQLAAMAPVAGHFDATELLTHSKSCVLNALKGAWDATGGAAIGIAKGFMDFVSNPIKAAGEFWDSAVNTYEKTKEFLTHFRSSINELKETLVGLPTEAKVSLVCNLVSRIGTSVLVGILTGGPAGMLRGVSALALNISRIKGVSSAISLISKLKIPKDKLGQAFDRILSSNNVRALDDMEFLASNNMGKMTWEMAQCGL